MIVCVFLGHLEDKYTNVLGRQITMHPFLANLWIRLASVIELKHSELTKRDDKSEAERLLHWLELIYSYVRVLYKSKLACNYDSSKVNTQLKMAVEWVSQAKPS